MSSFGDDTVASALSEALELPTVEQDEWLARLKLKDPALAAQIEPLLAVRRATWFSDFMSGTFPRPQEQTSASLVGKQVGAYSIDAQIGAGGMGSIWRAHRTDGRYQGVVALKFLHSAWLSRNGEARFRHEGEMLARLQHPNIARLLDAGVFEGQPYLVLEYVEGVSLNQYCDAHGLEAHDRCRLFLSVLTAVAHAHRHLIVHRDLKPSNLLVTSDGTVKLLDFGVAKLIADDADAGLTQMSAVALTPQYASPEQLLGKPVSTASDVYALGLMLYVLLTGAHPAAGHSRSSVELLQATLHEESKRCSEAAGLAPARRRQLRGDLDTIVGKALKKEPEERYGSAQALAEDLTRFLNNEPVQAAADSGLYRLRKFVRRRRTSVIVGAAVFVTLCATTLFALGQMFEARAQRDAADYQNIRASAQNELSEFLLGDSLADASPEAVRGRLDRARDLIHRRFADDPLLQANLLIGLSGRYIDAGDMKSGAAVMGEVEAIGKRTSDADLNVKIYCGKAEDAVEAGDLAGAHGAEQEGLKYLARIAAPPAGLIASCAVATAAIAERESNFARASAVLKDSLARLKAEGMERTPRYTSIAHEYGRALALAGNFRESWKTEQTLMAQLVATGRDNSDAYLAMNNVAAVALLDGGQPRTALKLIADTAARRAKSAPGATLPFYLEATRLLAGGDSGELRDTDQDLAQLVHTAEQAGMYVVVYAYGLGAVRAALQRDDLAAARDHLGALDTFLGGKSAGDPGRSNALRLLITRALVASAADDALGALKALDEIEARVPAAERRFERMWGAYLRTRVEVLARANRFEQALEAAGQALQRDRADAIDENASCWLGETYYWQARAERALGQTQSAQRDATLAVAQLKATVSSNHPLLAAALKLELD